MARIRDQWLEVDTEIHKSSLFDVRQMISDQVDSLFNFQDMLELEAKPLQAQFFNHLFRDLILPVLLGSLVITK
jgi:hypothetical protein